MENYEILYTIERFAFVFGNLKVLAGREPQGVIPWSSYILCKSAKCFPVTELRISAYVLPSISGIGEKLTVLRGGRSRDASLPCSSSIVLMSVILPLSSFCELCFKNESSEDQSFKVTMHESSLQRLTDLFIYGCRDSL